MLTAICPKLPMRNKRVTKDFYVNQLGFKEINPADFDHYLIIEKDSFQIHFFEFTALNPTENYGQIYIRIMAIETLYQSYLDAKVQIHPNGELEIKPWKQKEFSILDPDKNLLTFGESII